MWNNVCWLLAVPCALMLGCGENSDSSAPGDEEVPTRSGELTEPEPSPNGSALSCDGVIDNGRIYGDWFPTTPTEDHDEGPDYCTIRCDEGWADCDGQRANGCETDLNSEEGCAQCADACLAGLCASSPSCRHFGTDHTNWVIGSEWSVTHDDSPFAVNGDGVVLSGADAYGPAGPELMSSDGPEVSIQVSHSDGTFQWWARGMQRTVAVALQGDDAYVLGTATLEKFDLEGNVAWRRELPAGEAVDLTVDEAGNATIALVREPGAQVVEGVELPAPPDDFLGGSLLISVSADNDVRWVTGVEGKALQLGAALGRVYVYLDVLDLVLLALDDGTQDELFRADTGMRWPGRVAVSPDGSVSVFGIDEVGRVRSDHPVALTADDSLYQSSGLVLERYSADLEPQWHTAFGAMHEGLGALDVRVAPDGTAYLLGVIDDALTGIDDQSFVARVSPTGMQNGIILVDPDAEAERLFVGSDGSLYVSVVAYANLDFFPEYDTENYNLLLTHWSGFPEPTR